MEWKSVITFFNALESLDDSLPPTKLVVFCAISFKQRICSFLGSGGESKRDFKPFQDQQMRANVKNVPHSLSSQKNTSIRFKWKKTHKLGSNQASPWCLIKWNLLWGFPLRQFTTSSSSKIALTRRTLIWQNDQTGTGASLTKTVW